MNFEKWWEENQPPDGAYITDVDVEDAFKEGVRQALERAAQMLESKSGEATEFGFERFARYSKEAAQHVRALIEQGAQSGEKQK